MKKITAESLYEFKFPSNVSFSPNGEKLAYLVYSIDKEQNSYVSDIYLVSDDKTKRMTASGDAKSLIWESEEKILFTALRDKKHKEMKEKGEEITAFYSLPTDGGESSLAFTIPLNVTKMVKYSEDIYILTAVQDNFKSTAKKDDGDYFEFTELPFRFDGMGVVNGKRSRLYIYNSKTNELKAITDPFFNVSDFSFSDDYLLYSGYEYTEVKGIKNGLYLYDIKSGDIKTLIPQDEIKIGFAAILGDNTILATLTDMKEFGVNQFGDFFKISLDGKREKIASHDASVGGGSVNSDAKYGGGKTYVTTDDKLYFITTKGNYSYLLSIDNRGNISDKLTPNGSIDAVDVRGDKIASVMMCEQKLCEVYVNNVVVSTHNDEFSNTHNAIKPEEISVSCKDGYTITGYVMKPANYQKGKKYPAILNIHGGPRTVYSDVFLHEMQVWANEGYFVLYSNPIGSDGRGNLFGDINGHYGDTDYAELMEFVDYVLAEYSDIDEENVGITGGSYGGFMTNWAIGHTNRFKAAATQRSISNFINYEGVSDIGYYFNYDMMAAEIHGDICSVWNQSPLKYAQNIKTPTLFIHSSEDHRCRYDDSIQLFSILKRNAVPAKYVLFNGESHGLSRIGKPLNRLKRLNSITAWFNDYLK